MGVRLRVLFVIDGLDYGGAETQVIALSRELSRQGHAVAIYTLRTKNPRVGELSGSRVEVIEDDKRGKVDISLILRLRQFVDRFQPDIVHGFLLDGNLHARLAVAGKRVPALNSERSDNYKMPLQHRIAIALTRGLVGGLVANTHSGARFAQRYFRLSDEHVHVVWNGIDPRVAGASQPTVIDPRREFFQRPDLKVACHVGRIRPAKDHLLALQVARHLHGMDPTWRVLFIGDAFARAGTYPKRVEEAARDLVNAGVVAFAGLRNDARALMAAANVLFSTSVYEGFPNVVLEAMAAGTPVVTTDYSDVRMILPCEWQVTQNRSPHQLALAILRAEAERDTVCARQRSWLDRHATIEIVATRLERVYQQYLDRRPGRSAA